jgi:COP9 signalosome complex subunit 5
MMHCHSGVEKGIKKGGNPIEVMGLMMGRPDPEAPRQLIVTDVFPLPIEGFETRVIADDQDVVNYMIQLGESMERTRKEKFMGWYHSHPFDVGLHSHCFLSQTDLSTQLSWQRAEDPNGNPFLAVVIDPLRSLAKNTPILEGFRCYPPDYNSPIQNECPDGSIMMEEQARLERWGSCWARYYTIPVEYYMSAASKKIMESLTQNFLWMRTLGSTPMLESEYQQHYPERIVSMANKMRLVEASHAAQSASSQLSVAGLGGENTSGGSGTGEGSGRQSKAATAASATTEEDEIDKVCQGVVDLATEKLHGNIAQLTKKELFSCRCCQLFRPHSSFLPSSLLEEKKE